MDDTPTLYTVGELKDWLAEQLTRTPRFDQGAIFAALARAQKKFPMIPKTKTATIKTDKGSYSYNYADIADVLFAVRPILAEEGVAIVQRTDVLAAGGHILVTTLYADDGSSLESQWKMRDITDPQSVGGDMTFFRRYQLTALLGIASEDDDDNARSKSQPTREPSRPQVPQGTATTVEERRAFRDYLAEHVGGGSAILKDVMRMWMSAASIDARSASLTREQIAATKAKIAEMAETEPFDPAAPAASLEHDPEPDWCSKDVNCVLPDGHEGECQPEDEDAVHAAPGGA